MRWTSGSVSPRKSAAITGFSTATPGAWSKTYSGMPASRPPATSTSAPAADLQLRSLLVEEDQAGVTELLARIAAASERVIDGDGAA